MGMSTRHNSVRQYTLGEFAVEQERLHREMLREHLREEKLNSLKLKVKKKREGGQDPFPPPPTYGPKTLTVGLALDILGKVAVPLLKMAAVQSLPTSWH